MDTYSTKELNELLAEHSSPCISIYFATHPAGKEGEGDPLRLKTLTDGIEDQLLESAHRSTEVRELLSPLRTVMIDEMFWRNRSIGLAAFLSSELCRIYRLPIAFESRANVSDRFIVRPLLPLVLEDDQFYFLALSRHRVRLFSGDRFGLKLLEDPKLPTTMAPLIDADLDRTKQRDDGSNTGRRHSTIYYGHGGKPDEIKHEVERFLREVAIASHSLIQQRESPLLLGGVASMLSQFRRISMYPTIPLEQLEENCDRLSESQLYNRVWPLVHAFQASEQKRKIADAYERAAPSRCLQDVGRILQAADAGQIEILLVAADASLYGEFDHDAKELRVTSGDCANDDLADYAASCTLRHHGQVFVVDKQEIPNEREISAILRK
jgi:hypothetical protein